VSLPYPKYGLKSLYLFPYHQTREDYERATGSVCPPFDSARAPKNWLDPSAAKSTKRNVAYQFALVTADNGTAIPGPDGKPQLDVLVLKKEEAATVNIPPNATNVPGADVPEVPCPCARWNRTRNLPSASAEWSKCGTSASTLRPPRRATSRQQTGSVFSQSRRRWA